MQTICFAVSYGATIAPFALEAFENDAASGPPTTPCDVTGCYVSACKGKKKYHPSMLGRKHFG